MSDTGEEPILLLRDAVARGLSSAVHGLLANASEEERLALRGALVKELRARIKELREALRIPSGRGSEDPREVARQIGEWQKHYESRTASLDACRLAVAGIGTRREAEAALFGGRQFPQWNEYRKPTHEHFWYLAGLVVAARPEGWRQEVLLRLLAMEENRATGALTSLTRLALGLHLARTGALPREEALPGLSRLLRQSGFYKMDWSDDLLLDVVWAALEARDEPPLAGSGQQLHDPIVECVAAGRMDRERLFALALRRLAEISRPFEVNWWASLLGRLAPSPEDWTAHPEAALDLIAAPTARAASVGLAAARQLLAKKAVSPQELLPPLSAAVGSEAVGVAKGAVSLLRAVAKRDETLRAQALEMALGALTHPKPAVQEAVLAWLEAESAWRREEALAAQVAELAACAAPAAAARLRRILDAAALAAQAERLPPTGAPEAPAGEDMAASAAVSPPPDSQLRAALTRRLQDETDPRRRGWLQACFDTLHGQGEPPEPLPTDPGFWRREPPFTLPETPEETAQLLLTPSQVYSQGAVMERVLAGIRLPLPVEERKSLCRLLDPVLKDPAVGPLVQLWTSPDTPRIDAETNWRALGLWRRPEGWLRRAAGACQALRRGCREVPLCTPTQETGWLDPEVLARRLAVRKRLEPEEILELSSALYRLPPDEAARARAWSSLAPMIRRFDRRVRCALEAALDPARRSARLRHSLGILIGGLPSLEWVRLAFSAAGWSGTPEMPTSLRAILRGVPGVTPEMLPELALPDPVGAWVPLGDLAFTAPSLAEPLIHAALVPRPAEVRYWGYPGLWEPALHLACRPDIALRPLLPRLIALCAEGEHPVREALAELLLTGLSDGRLRTGDLLEQFGRALATREKKPRVVLAMLQRLAGESPVLREAAACCAEQALALGLDGVTAAERVALLEALLAWRSASGRAVEDEAARARLSILAGERKSNRTVDLARQLVQLPPAPAGTASSRGLCREHDVTLFLRSVPSVAELA